MEKLLFGAMLLALTILVPIPTMAGEKDYASAFPLTIPGWTASQVQSESIPLEGKNLCLSLSRVYSNRQKKGKIHMRIDTCGSWAAVGDDLANAFSTYLSGKEVMDYKIGTYYGFDLYGDDKNPRKIWFTIPEDIRVIIIRENASFDDMITYLKNTDIEKIKKVNQKIPN